MFWNELERSGRDAALRTDRGERVSYADLARLADETGFGSRPRTLALVAMENSVAAVAAYLGALRAGHAVILVNGDDGLAWRHTEARYAPELSWSSARGLEAGPGSRGPDLHPDLTLLLSTSGSTGSAKLVRLSAAAVDANAASIRECLGIKAADRAITTLPPAYSYGLSVINSHLLAGASLILTDGSVAHDAFRSLAVREGATSMAGVPYTYEMLEASRFLDRLPASLTVLTQAGGRLGADAVLRVREAAARQGARFFVMYGQTEATARMAYVPPDTLARYPDCIGQAIPGGRFELCDPDTGLPADAAGELVYHGPNVMMGYAETRSDLARGAELDGLRTGDLAEVAAPGMLRITGRKSRFLKMFGLRIALDEVEGEALRRGWRVTATGNEAQLVLATDDPRDPAVLAEALADWFKLPLARITPVPLERLPRLPSGKVDYGAILAAAGNRVPAPGGTPLDAYAALLARLARRAEIDERTTFQSLGGDSLNYVEAAMLLEQALGQAPVGWERMTPRELAACVPSGNGDRRAALPAGLGMRSVQAMRSIAITLVVAAHSVQAPAIMFGYDPTQVSRVWFRHVNSVFIFVAGYLFQSLLESFRYRNYLLNKTRTVILPYLLMSVPALVIVIGVHHPLSHLPVPEWAQAPPLRVVFLLLTGSHLGPFWFIPMIVLFYVASPVFQWIDRNPAAYGSILPMLCVSALIGRNAVNGYTLQAFVFYLPAYLTGMAVSHHEARIVPVLQRLWPLLLASYFLVNLVDPSSQAAELIGLVSKVTFSLGLVGVLTLYGEQVPERIGWIGALSFGIYFVHSYLTLAVGPLAKAVHFTDPGGIAFVTLSGLFSAAVLGVSVAIVVLVRRLLGRHSRTVIGA